MVNLRAKIINILNSLKENKSSEFETDLILFHAFRRDYPKLRTLADLKLVSPTCNSEIEATTVQIAENRIQGIPLQHLLGNQFFYEHEYLVNDSTLIPRPETEVLVLEALTWLEKKYADRPFRFIELGLGSGVISGEILARFKHARGFASEINPLAIALARQNLEHILGRNFDERFVIQEPDDESMGFELFLEKAPYDLVISNPPYLSVNDEIDFEVLTHEPHLALFPKTTGDRENPNYFYENFLLHAKELLKSNGVAFFEVPHERAEVLLHSFQNAGFSKARLISDLTGRHRVLQAAF